VTLSWGTVPDWFGAVGTVLSFFVVGLSLRNEIRNRRISDERYRRQIEDDDARQARLISVGWKRLGVTEGELSFLNDSDGPIKAITVALLTIDGDGTVQTLANFGNGSAWPEGAPLTDGWLGLGSRKSLAITFPFGAHFEGRKLTIRYVVEFTDVHGRRWRSTGSALPERVIV
jgi:hypothetical protein